MVPGLRLEIRSKGMRNTSALCYTLLYNDQSSVSVEGCGGGLGEVVRCRSGPAHGKLTCQVVFAVLILFFFTTKDVRNVTVMSQ